MALAKIVYASMTGNTEEIADIVGQKIGRIGSHCGCETSVQRLMPLILKMRTSVS